MAERVGGKVEAVIAAAIFVVVVVLFVKYYEPASTANSTAGTKPVAAEKPAQ